MGGEGILCYFTITFASQMRGQRLLTFRDPTGKSTENKIIKEGAAGQ